MDSIGEKLIILSALLKNALEGKDSNSKNSFKHKDKLLCMLLSSPLRPREAMSLLGLDKSNLNHLCTLLIKEGLIEREQDGTDQKCIRYCINENGRDYINKQINSINSRFSKILTEQQSVDALSDNLDELLRILSFL